MLTDQMTSLKKQSHWLEAYHPGGGGKGQNAGKISHNTSYALQKTLDKLKISFSSRLIQPCCFKGVFISSVHVKPVIIELA